MSQGYRSTPYACGFRHGERKAFATRAAGMPLDERPLEQDLQSPRDRGFWDGYTPRSPQWADDPLGQARRVLSSLGRWGPFGGGYRGPRE